MTNILCTNAMLSVLYLYLGHHDSTRCAISALETHDNVPVLQVIKTVNSTGILRV